MVGVEARLLRGGGPSFLYFLTRDNAGEQLVSPDEGEPGQPAREAGCTADTLPRPLGYRKSQTF